MSAKLAALRSTGVLAVLRAPSADSAIRAASALTAGGVSGLEITYSTPDAAEVIRRLAQEYGSSIYLGAGTVRNRRQAEEAAEAGAQFLVSPGTWPELTAAMKATGMVVMTGALTPTEVVTAADLGADVVKIFPASLGGPEYLRALRGPLPDIELMPTGGVSPDNVKEWFRSGAVAVGAGSDLCSGADLAAERYNNIERRARAFRTALEASRG